MKFKNLLKTITFLLFVALSCPFTSTAGVYTNTLPDSAADARLYTTIVTRVAEIQGMDLKNLSVSEKKELKKELKKMKHTAESQSRGLYLSLGAVILIIILLILIL